MRPWVPLAAVVTLLIGASGARGVLAAFVSETHNGGNRIAAGTVAIDDDDAGTALMSLTSARAGDSRTACIQVGYSGSLPSTVRLYGATTGTGLDPYIDLEVTRGTSPAPAFNACTGFTPDPTDYVGAGAGVVFTGTLDTFSDDFASGLIDPPSGASEIWTTGERHVYRFRAVLRNDPAAQGKNASQTFTWEARSQ